MSMVETTSDGVKYAKLGLTSVELWLEIKLEKASHYVVTTH